MNKPDDPSAARGISVYPTFEERGRAFDAQLIERSWARSLRYGISPADRVLFEAPQLVRPRELREYGGPLLEAARPEMEQLHASLAPRDWVLACIDMDGVVLNAIGKCNSANRELNQVFRQGAQFLETLVGTTAPSCALAEKESVVISGPEHYLEEARAFTCMATPIFAVDGGIVGVLDASRKGPVSSAYTLESLVIAARAIERRLFTQLGDVLLVHLHCRLDILGTPMEGLLAFDAGGKLRGANRIARQLFGEPELKIGIDFADLFDMPFAHAVCYRRYDLSVPFRLQTHSGSQLHACVTASPTKGASTPSRIAFEGRRADVAERGPCLEDPAVSEALERARKAFARNIPVLLNGETGTGKEVFARLLHDEGPRAAGPFVAINCSSIPASLIESELFGHVEGAFTGSRKGGAAGKIEQAHRGTLFLDEIGDMPMELQGRLLRVLQERSLCRLGGTSLIEVDFALVCATHRDLLQLTGEQGFREDLYYRINGFRVALPALRERSDLARLIQHLLRGETSGQHPPALDGVALKALLAYHWPGNIRQLHQVLRLAAAFAEDEGIIRLDHLPAEVLQARPLSVPPLEVPEGTLQASEQRAIRAAIDACQGNLSAAARSLGIGRATLYRKLKTMD
ncbi:transcriptional regulator [Pseudomonas sp. 1239]|uniref:sigma-54-dependent Fis family transcriptional regulator n=1 Tax=Pseudomonas TaxID=286 RepID=UPI0005C2D80F|nr:MULTISPECIES: sigma-54-dependent Fis family transcriptional regulator [Pseudomonas]KIU52294.1 transcriptional regulator [Pseudomonas putida]OUM35512.1 transcriptional regulator [Pseudomonas sp. 1239]WKL66503.1 sigma-54-dependent Fis family transcriptional regulator [Pseudomonas qingdaonensis]